MKVQIPERPKSLPKWMYEVSKAYCQVIADRFEYKARTAISIVNWQIRVQEISFVSSRGIDKRIRLYFPVNKQRRIVVSLDKAAKSEEIWKLLHVLQNYAKIGAVSEFKRTLNKLLDYCLEHRPLLYVEYSTKGSYMLSKPKTLRLR